MPPIKDTFQQPRLEEKPPSLSDYLYVKDGVVVLRGALQTENFIAGKRGVQMRFEGLNANGGNIQGATIGGTVLGVSSGGTGAATLTGILKGNGVGAFTAIVGVSGSFYAANSSGGSPTHLVTVTNGIITAIA